MKEQIFVLLSLLLLAACSSVQPVAVQSINPLTEQVETLLAEKEIQQVKYRYGEYMDDKDFEKFATVFADTVIVDMRDRGGQLMTLPRATVVGFYQKNLAKIQTQHFLTNMDIAINGKEARARTNYYSIHKRGDKRVDSTGFSEETYIKTANGWKISSVKLVPYISPVYE